MKVVSFIIPSYNSEKYLDTCLPSFFEETVLDKLDIIIVNDGSKDATAEIAEKYCRMHPNSVRLISQENKGHGGALNTGCAAAVGKYLKVIDSDDWVITENLPAYVSYLEECQADAVLTHFHLVDMTSRERQAKPVKYLPKEPVSIETIMEHWSEFEDSCSFHGITYKTEFYQRIGHQLPEHVFYEDQEYSAIPFCEAASIGVLDLYLYQYLVGNPYQSVAFENQVKRIDHIERVVLDMVSYYENKPQMSQAARAYLFARSRAVSLIYLSVASLYGKDWARGRKLCRDFYAKLKTVCPDMAGGIRKKYLIFLLLNAVHMSPATYRKLVESGGYKKLKYSGKQEA